MLGATVGVGAIEANYTISSVLMARCGALGAREIPRKSKQESVGLKYPWEQRPGPVVRELSPRALRYRAPLWTCSWLLSALRLLSPTSYVKLTLEGLEARSTYLCRGVGRCILREGNSGSSRLYTLLPGAG